MKIYIASSARNMHGVQLLRDRLAGRGHTVLDWTAYAPPLADHLSPEARRTALDSDERGEIFSFCVQACLEADLLIYLGAAGQDAACEVGMAYGAGVPVLGLAAPTEKPGLILTRAIKRWFGEVTSLLDYLELMQAKANDKINV